MKIANAALSIVVLIPFDALADSVYSSDTHLWTSSQNTSGLALSGATVALPAGKEGHWDNPAALAILVRKYSTSFEIGKPRESRGNDGMRTPSPSYSYDGLASAKLMDGILGVGVGFRKTEQQARRPGGTYRNLGFERQAQMLPISVAFRPFDEVALGTTLEFFSVREARSERYSFENTYTGTREQRFNGLTVIVGGIYAMNENFTAGFTFQPHSKVAAAKTVTTSQALRDGASAYYRPAKFQAGVAFRAPPLLSDIGGFPLDLTLLAQLDAVHFTEIKAGDRVVNSAAVLWNQESTSFSLASPEISETQLSYDTSLRLSPRIALECMIFRDGFFSVSGMAGSYFEPGLYKESKGRGHLSGGLTFGAGFFSGRVAFDRAKDFQNVKLGVGAAFELR